MRQGRELEDYVAKRFTEKTGKKVRRENHFLINLSFPFAHANVDRMVIGEDAGLECKTTTTLNLKQFKNGEYPAQYYVQCVHYMAVTGCQKWYLAILVLGKGFYVFEIERDEEEISALMKSEAEFWQLVRTETPPMADGSEATTKTISAIYAESTEETANLIAYEADLQEYMRLSESIKQLEKIRDEAANKVKDFLGSLCGGESEGFKVSWKSASKSTFDSKRFAKENPNIDLTTYYKATSYRTFKVTAK
jgi:predicted phage-related endonuclease